MQRTSDRLIFAVILLLIFASAAYAPRYMYLSECEQTRLGEYVRFWHGDTLQGPVHSNSLICIMQDPQFYDEVSTTAPDFEHGSGYNPGFHGPAPIFNAPVVLFPRSTQSIRDGAMVSGTFYDTPGKSYRLRFCGDSAVIYQWWTGTLFDSTDRFTVDVFPQRCMFFDAHLEVLGHLRGRVSVGCSHNIMIIDNVLYDDADSLTGYTPLESGNFLMLASEADIKIANTYANGRNNSNGRGNSQTNQDSASVVISAALYALGESFTFEQQNDPDSGYVYQEPVGTPHMDDRGTIYLFGSLAQWRRGYVHRPNGGSTGYLKHYRFDTRFPNIVPPCPFALDDPNENPHTTDSIDFGGVPVGATVWDTAYVYTPTFSTLGSVLATPPFAALRIEPFEGSSFAIPVSITAPHTGQFSGVLQVSTTYHFFQIVLRAQGLPGGSPPLHFDVAPNPFNLTTTIHYAIPQGGAVKITLYDVLGRIARQMDVPAAEAGEHSVQLQATDLASGVYFVHLQAGGLAMTKKVLLLK